MEVEIKPPLNWGLPLPTNTLQVPNSFSEIEHGVPHFLCEEVDANYSEFDQEGKVHNIVSNQNARKIATYQCI